MELEAYGTRREVPLYISTMPSAIVALVLIVAPFPILCTSVFEVTLLLHSNDRASLNIHDGLR